MTRTALLALLDAHTTAESRRVHATTEFFATATPTAETRKERTAALTEAVTAYTALLSGIHALEIPE